MVCRVPIQNSLITDTYSEVFTEPSRSIRHSSRLGGTVVSHTVLGTAESSKKTEDRIYTE